MISILMPTLNRADFVIRALHYYYRAGFSGHIIIGDSSGPEESTRIKEVVAELGDVLQIIYRHYSQDEYPHEGYCIKAMIEESPDPFAIVSGDHDFLVPRGLDQCAHFLQEHPDYSAAHGWRIDFHLDRKGAWGLLKSVYGTGEIGIESSSPQERWVQYMNSGFSTKHYVHRIQTWREMYAKVDQVPSRYLGSKLLPCSFSALSGKIKSLDCLTLLLQKGERPAQEWKQVSLMEQINQPSWVPSAKVVHDALVGSLRDLANLTPDQAKELYEMQMWKYLGRALISQYQERFEAQDTPTTDRPNQLGQSMNPTWIYYQDFRRVYLSLSTPL